jgi:hypothetical protein
MKKLFTILILIVSVNSNAQVLCGTTNESGSITLTAPPDNAFTSIEFASYGTPNGACGSFTIGACHAANSESICEGIFVGQNSATISATNGVFGDPCGGTFKRLYIQARYSSTLPLTLVSFTAQKIEQSQVKLAWVSDNEINTSHFIIERSTDGILFKTVGSVPAVGSGKNNYSFINTIPNIPSTYYYRLKNFDIDGKYKYSAIVRINNSDAIIKLSVFPIPATEFITIISGKKQEAFITNNIGQSIKNILLIRGNQTVNIAGWPTGVYFIKSEEAVIKFIKK